MVSAADKNKEHPVPTKCVYATKSHFQTESVFFAKVASDLNLTCESDLKVETCFDLSLEQSTNSLGKSEKAKSGQCFHPSLCVSSSSPL